MKIGWLLKNKFIRRIEWPPSCLFLEEKERRIEWPFNYLLLKEKGKLNGRSIILYINRKFQVFSLPMLSRKLGSHLIFLFLKKHEN
jgi:hypothetical protein